MARCSTMTVSQPLSTGVSVPFSTTIRMERGPRRRQRPTRLEVRTAEARRTTTTIIVLPVAKEKFSSPAGSCCSRCRLHNSRPGFSSPPRSCQLPLRTTDTSCTASSCYILLSAGSQGQVAADQRQQSQSSYGYEPLRRTFRALLPPGRSSTKWVIPALQGDRCSFLLMKDSIPSQAVSNLYSVWWGTTPQRQYSY